MMFSNFSLLFQWSLLLLHQNCVSLRCRLSNCGVTSRMPSYNQSTLLKGFFSLFGIFLDHFVDEKLVNGSKCVSRVSFLFRWDDVVCLNVMGYMRGDHASVYLVDCRKACDWAVVWRVLCFFFSSRPVWFFLLVTTVGWCLALPSGCSIWQLLSYGGMKISSTRSFGFDQSQDFSN